MTRLTAILAIVFCSVSSHVHADVLQFDAEVEESTSIEICNSLQECVAAEATIFHDHPESTVTVFHAFKNGETYYLTQNGRAVSETISYTSYRFLNFESLLEKGALLLLGAFVSLGSALATLGMNEKRNRAKKLKEIYSVIEGWTGDKGKLYDALSELDLSNGRLRLIKNSSQETLRKFDQNEASRADTIKQLKNDVKLVV